MLALLLLASFALAGLGLIANAFGGNGLGKKSVAFGTKINSLVPARQGAYTRVTTFKYTAAGTAHTVTALRSIGRAKLAAGAAASQAVVVLDRDPSPAGNAIAANDYVSYRNDDGTFVFDTVASVSSDKKTITLTTNLVSAISAGADFWLHGVAADTDPKTGSAHPTYPAPASVTTTYTDNVQGVISSNDRDEPILLQSDNITATGSLDAVSYCYTRD